MLTSLIACIHYEASEEQHFTTLLEFPNVMEVREDDEEFQNKVDEYEQEQKSADKFIVLVNK